MVGSDVMRGSWSGVMCVVGGVWSGVMWWEELVWCVVLKQRAGIS